MYRIDRIRKDGVDIIQLILCILYIHVRNFGHDLDVNKFEQKTTKN